MTNLSSIAGGAVLAAVGALLAVAALDPVDIKSGEAAVELAQSCAVQAAACTARRA